jgi:hypothetical protein
VTTERLIGIALPLDEEHKLLVQDVRSARERARKAEPGDRIDVIRYEMLSSQLEAWAYKSVDGGNVAIFGLPAASDVAGLHIAADGGVPPWVPTDQRNKLSAVLDGGGVLVTLRMPLEIGATAVSGARKAPPSPAAVWEAPPGVRGAQAVEKRFADQLEEALQSPESPRPFIPSGVSNVVLTNSLREYVGRPGSRVDAPAEYKDGSRARHLFPLRSLKFLPSPRGPFDLSVKFALLSIRHTEMDVVVDGAWLRNVQISQQRAAAETDDLVYKISREQLAELTANGKRVMMEMYQTGLQPAVVGFYRALVDHLLAQPGSVTVRPMYFQEPRKQPAQPGRRNGPRQGRQQQRRPTDGTVVTASSHFQAGKEWATAPNGDR